MKLCIFFLSILFFIFSCGDGNEKNIIKTIKLDIGFNYLPKNSGAFTDRNDGTQYLYFGDLVTKKCIRIFDVEGQLKQNIPIQKEAFDYLQQIDGLSIISPDTIVLNSLYTNRICIINRKGEQWYKMNLQGKVHDSLGNTYEITRSTQNVDQTRNRFVFGLNYVGNINDTIGNESEIDNFRKYYERSNNAAYFLKITDPFTIPKLSFCLYRFYQEIVGDSIAPVELENIYVVNKQIFVLSNYSSFIYQIDTLNGKIKSKHVISSDNTPLNFTPYNFDMVNNINIQDYVDQNTGYRGKIYKMLEDHNGNIAVFAYHDIKARMSTRPFSIILYSNKFEKLKEFSFEDGLYMGNSSISTENGILLRKINSKTNANEAVEFSLFNFR